MDGLNVYRTTRVAEILADFRDLQYNIAACPVEPEDLEDYYAEGWAVLRQTALDGQHILNCGADVSVPQTTGGADEQAKAELKQILLDAFARRHEGRKIYLRQAAAHRWADARKRILMGGQPRQENLAQLRNCDQRLHADLSAITDEFVYGEYQAIDYQYGRWTAEDPSLRSIQRWVRSRRA